MSRMEGTTSVRPGGGLWRASSAGRQVHACAPPGHAERPAAAPQEQTEDRMTDQGLSALPTFDDYLLNQASL